MKITLSRHELVDALSAITTVVGGRTAKPILGCVRLVTEGDVLELGGTDGEASLRLAMRALAVSEPGETAIPADRLLSIVREMPDAEIHLDADQRACTVRGVGSKFKIFTFPPADFPALPEFGKEPDLTVNAHQLQRMIALTAYAAARETGRYAINGVLWQQQGRKLFLVATDGRRLARAGGQVLDSNAADFQVTVPVKALRAFEKVFTTGKDRDNATVDVRVTPNQLLLRTADRLLSTTLVEGHFPKYEDVIPRDSDKLARIARADLLGAIRRAAVLTSEEARAVRLSFEKDQLVITAQSPEQGEARVELPIKYDGTPVEIAFNAGYVTEVLSVLAHDEVVMEFKESFRPGIVRGEDKSEFLYVIMPVSL